MIKVTSSISINESDLIISFIRSPGPGGQNVNKLATGAVLRVNVLQALNLPERVRERLIKLVESKITNAGDLIIKATRFRTQERNKQDAIDRLVALLRRAATIPKKRKPTKPTRSSAERRITKKKTHGKNKALRSRKPSAEY
jgi:ribosome-associated protein